MAEIKTAYGGQTPKNNDNDSEVDELIENANRLLESVYRDINMSTINSIRCSVNMSTISSVRRSPRAAPSNSRSCTPAPLENWRDAEIERINRFCDTIDLDAIQTPEAVQSHPITRRSARVRDSALLAEETSPNECDFNTRHRSLQFNTNGNDIIDLVNQSSPNMESLPMGMINDVDVNGDYDEDDDVIIVSSELDPVVDLCLPVRQNTHRSRSPLHQRQCPMHTSTTHTQRPQQQRQLQLPNPAVPNSEATGDIAASSSNERVVLICPVCMESSVKRRPTSTKCGHIFCESCINNAIRITHRCPLCNMKLNNKMKFRIYL